MAATIRSNLWSPEIHYNYRATNVTLVYAVYYHYTLLQINELQCVYKNEAHVEKIGKDWVKLSKILVTYM